MRGYLLCSMWDLPRSGIEPVSPALAGGFFTTEPPGKPRTSLFKERERERAECLKTSKRILIHRVNNKCNYRKLVVTSDLKLQVTSLWGNFPCWNFASHFFSSSISLPEMSCSQILVAQSCMPGTQNLRGFTWLTKNPNQRQPGFFPRARTEQ